MHSGPGGSSGETVSSVLVIYRPANGAGHIVLDVDAYRHDWDKVADFCAQAIGLKVPVADPVFDQIMAARKVKK